MYSQCLAQFRVCRNNSCQSVNKTIISMKYLSYNFVNSHIDKGDWTQYSWKIHRPFCAFNTPTRWKREWSSFRLWTKFIWRNNSIWRKKIHFMKKVHLFFLKRAHNDELNDFWSSKCTCKNKKIKYASKTSKY